MAARKPPQEFIPATDPETQSQIEYGRRMALAETQNPPSVSEPESEGDPDDIALQNVLSELGSSGSDAKVNIYQLDARQNRAFIGAFLPSEFGLERVQAEYGAGDYEIRVYNAGRLVTRKVVKIATPKNGQTVTLPNQSAPIDNSKIIETMQAGFAQMGQMFMQGLQAIAQKPEKPEKSTLDTLKEFAMIKELFSPPPQQSNDPMQMIKLAMDLSEKMNPRESDPSAGEIILKAVENFAPAINDLMTKQTAPAHAPIIQAPQIPAIPAPQTEDIDMSMMQKIYAKTLLAAAKSDASPETYANNILDLLPREQVEQFIARPEWFDDVVVALPEAAPHREWFEELKSCINEMLTEGVEPPSVEPDAKTVPANVDSGNPH